MRFFSVALFFCCLAVATHSPASARPNPNPVRYVPFPHSGRLRAMSASDRTFDQGAMMNRGVMGGGVGMTTLQQQQQHPFSTSDRDIDRAVPVPPAVGTPINRYDIPEDMGDEKDLSEADDQDEEEVGEDAEGQEIGDDDDEGGMEQEQDDDDAESNAEQLADAEGELQEGADAETDEVDMDGVE